MTLCAMVGRVNDQPRLVSSSVAARALGVHPGTLWRWKDRGWVTPAAETAGKHLRWDLTDLRAQIAAIPSLEVYPVTPPANIPEQPPVVAAIVTSHLGVLGGRRNDGKPPWTFIAGEVEPGESIADAAVREVKEETGLLVRAAHQEIGRRVHPKTGRTMIYLACTPTEGTDVFVGDADELAEVRWIGLGDVDELLPGMFRPVRQHLARVLA